MAVRVVTVPAVLTVQRRILELENEVAARRRSRWSALGVAHEQFGLSETRYYQELVATLRDPEALIEFPMLVNRLNRLLGLTTATSTSQRKSGQSPR